MAVVDRVAIFLKTGSTRSSGLGSTERREGVGVVIVLAL